MSTPVTSSLGLVTSKLTKECSINMTTRPTSASTAMECGWDPEDRMRPEDLGRVGDHSWRVITGFKERVRPDLKDVWAAAKYHERPEVLPVPKEVEKSIPIINGKDMSVAEFVDKFERRNLPCLIEGLADDWPAMRRWTFQKLYRRLRHLTVRIGDDDDKTALKIKLKYFLRYLRDQKDDSPLYVFDYHFATHKQGKRLLDDFAVPHLFPDDLFALAKGVDRPPFRWLLIGPTRSGTCLHIDPLGTSAWNTLISGHKRWVLFRPETPPEWIQDKAYLKAGEDNEAIDYFTRILPRIREAHPDLEVWEFVQDPGQTIFVPSGWWHAVLNIDQSVAITQNYTGRENWKYSWPKLRQGRPDVAEKLMKALETHYPDLVEAAHAMNKRDGWEGPTEDDKEKARIAAAQQAANNRELSDDDEEDFIKALMRGMPSSGSSSDGDSDAGIVWTSEADTTADARVVVETEAAGAGAGAGAGAAAPAVAAVATTSEEAVPASAGPGEGGEAAASAEGDAATTEAKA